MAKIARKLCPLIVIACLFASCFPDTKEIYIVWDSEKGNVRIDGDVVDPIKRDFGWVSLPGEDSYCINADGSTHSLEFIPNSGYAFLRWTECEQYFEAQNIIAEYRENPVIYEAKINRSDPGLFTMYRQFLCARAREE